MSSDVVFWLSIGLKLVLTAGIVVSASVVVERAGPLVGALVVTLPVTVWPAYVFLAMDHDAIYLFSSAEAGLAVNAASGVFMLIYLMLAQKRGLAVSLGVAVGSWIFLAQVVRSLNWTLYSAGLLNLLVFAICITLSWRYRGVTAPRMTRQWYELPLRTALVCALMAAVLLLSHWGGAEVTGMVAVYPISTTCTMLILHARIGGRASAAVISNGLWGIFGIGIGLFGMASTVKSSGIPLALGLLLAIPVTWNLSIWYLRRRRA